MVGIGVRYTCSLLVVGLMFTSLLEQVDEPVEPVEDNEHKDADEPWDLKDAVDDVITTDIRLDGRPRINTVSNK